MKSKLFLIFLVALLAVASVAVFAACGEIEEAVFGDPNVATEGLVYQLRENGSWVNDFTLVSGEQPPEVESDGYWVVDYTGTSSKVVVPATYQGKPVAGLLNGCFSEESRSLNIKSVYMNDGIMYLGDNVFASNKTVAAVRFPNTLIKIGNGAFFDADSIVDIDMPDSVIEIGDNVFTFCDSLTSVKISNGLNVIKENMFGLCNNLFIVTFGPNIKIIEDMAFLFNDKLNRIIFNGTVEQFNSIEFGTFWLGSVVKVICTDDVLQLR